MMTSSIKSLLKGLRYIARMFEHNKEPEIQIGNPTDVKHVAHIGWEGPSASTPSWMTEFKSPELKPEPVETKNKKSGSSSNQTEKQKQKGKRKSSTSTSTGQGSSSGSKQSKQRKAKGSAGSGSGESASVRPASTKEGEESVSGVCPFTELGTSKGR